MAAEKAKKKKIENRGSAKGQQITMICVIIAICILWSILSPFFLTVDNFVTVIHTMCVTTIAGYAMTVCLINGGVDLSLGYTICFSGITTAMVIYGDGSNNGSVPLAVGLLVYHETVSLRQGLGVLVCLAGIYLVGA